MQKLYSIIQCNYTAFISTPVVVNMFYLNMILDSTRIKNTDFMAEGKETQTLCPMVDEVYLFKILHKEGQSLGILKQSELNLEVKG